MTDAPATPPPGSPAPAEPTLDDVCALAIDAGLADDAYRALLIPDPALQAEMPSRAPTDKARLIADLLALAALRDADDRPVHLAAWLRTAATLTAPKPASAQFAAWAARADRPGAFPPPSRRPRRRRWALGAIGAALLAAVIAAALTLDRPLDWPGPAPVRVELPSGPLRVDRDEASRADLGDCHLPEPPGDQRAWCAALAGVIDVDAIDDAVIAGTGRRSVVGVTPAVAERICALRDMRLPRDDEYTALLALGRPAWPAGHDVRGPQRIARLATGAAELVRVDGGHRVRGLPMVSPAAARLIAMDPEKARREVMAPPLAEAVAGPDTGFRCVGDE